MLEAIVKRLEEEEIPLESALKLFAEGQTLARACEEQLRAAENEVRKLLEKADGAIEEAPLDTAEPDDDDNDGNEDEDDNANKNEGHAQDQSAHKRHGGPARRGDKDNLPF